MARLLLGVATLVLSAAPAVLAAEAQQQASVRRIGILEAGWAPPARTTEPVISALGALGWAEGRNLVVERRYAEGRYNRLVELAVGLLNAKVEVLVPVGADAAQAARQATATVPIVFVAVPAPAQVLPIRSVAKPGGNATGSAFDLPQSEFATLPRLLREATPSVFRQGVLWDPAIPGMSQAISAAYYSQEEANLNYRAFEVRSVPDLEDAFDKIRKERVRAVFVLPSPAATAYRASILNFMTKNRIPALYPSRDFVEAGGLMAYGPSWADAHAQAAELVDQVLKGAHPGDLPIRAPVRFQPVINLKTARALGLTLPQSLLDRSERLGE
ncbi:MAG TPA: ABC transporter substrate-binding protein [Methylomirabilota bacterium]|nr:ABC transporter substrate-binding protein [Methylomirabilota bacterium]